MKTEFEFGKSTRELELARQKIARRRTKRILTLAGILAVIVLIISFRSAIKEGFDSSKGNKADITRSVSSNTGGATAGIRITERKDLPKELLEISGLAYMDSERFACVQDEEGTVFIYNAAKEQIEKEIQFGDKGDYEGLAIVGETFWVLRSDGTLFEINNSNGQQPSAKEYDTPLSISDDTEGLCYDEKNNRLLVAVKEGRSGEDSKGIYAFDLAAKNMLAEPVFKINLQDEKLSTEQKSKKKADGFMPSGIVIHPRTGDIFITEGRKAKLLIMDTKGSIRNLYHLDKNDFVQPEGITFSPSGELFISNEGTKQAGNILKIELEN